MLSRQRAILNFLDELSSVNMHGFLLSLNGETLAEGYWYPFGPKEPHRLYSVSKSVTSLAIGILAGEGRILLDTPIVSYFPEWVNEKTPDLLREVTIRHMLTMSTCFDRSMYNVTMADWTKPFFDGEPTHPAGMLFHYDTSASQVMCALVEKLTGQEMLAFVQERIFTPIGANGPKRWLKDKAGTSQGGTGLLMTLRDFSKLADFCMSDGRGLIPVDYLRAATTCQISTLERTAPEERYGYGYQFWRMRKGFSMYGLGGQMAMCLPEQGLSLCTTAHVMLSSTGVQPLYDAFFRHLDGIGALADDPADSAELTERLAALKLSAVQSDIANRNTIAVNLVRGELPFHALTIAPDELIFHMDDDCYSLPYANGDWANGIFPATTEACITTGGWLDDNHFLARCEVKGDFINGIELLVSLSGTRAALRINGSLWELAPGWNGLAWGQLCV